MENALELQAHRNWSVVLTAVLQRQSGCCCEFVTSTCCYRFNAIINALRNKHFGCCLCLISVTKHANSSVQVPSTYGLVVFPHPPDPGAPMIQQSADLLDVPVVHKTQ